MTRAKVDAVQCTLLVILLLASCSRIEVVHAFSSIRVAPKTTRSNSLPPTPLKHRQLLVQESHLNSYFCNSGQRRISCWLFPNKENHAVGKQRLPSELRASSSEEEEEESGPSSLAFIAAFQQSLLIGAAVVGAMILNTPNYGLGPNFDLQGSSLSNGLLATLPLLATSLGLEVIEDRFQALQDVSKASQRAVIALLGTTWTPAFAVVMCFVLGSVAGVGEEMLFRGVVQYEVAARFGSMLSIGLTSVLFGILHAVTPLYAALAGIASIYFGVLYESTSNLAIPIISHSLYDFGALLYAHWTVTHMTKSEQDDILNWKGPNEKEDSDDASNVDLKTML